MMNRSIRALLVPSFTLALGLALMGCTAKEPTGPSGPPPSVKGMEKGSDKMNKMMEEKRKEATDKDKGEKDKGEKDQAKPKAGKAD